MPDATDLGEAAAQLTITAAPAQSMLILNRANAALQAVRADTDAAEEVSRAHGEEQERYVLEEALPDMEIAPLTLPKIFRLPQAILAYEMADLGDNGTAINSLATVTTKDHAALKKVVGAVRENASTIGEMADRLLATERGCRRMGTFIDGARPLAAEIQRIDGNTASLISQQQAINSSNLRTASMIEVLTARADAAEAELAQLKHAQQQQGHLSAVQSAGGAAMLQQPPTDGAAMQQHGFMPHGGSGMLGDQEDELMGEDDDEHRVPETVEKPLTELPFDHFWLQLPSDRNPNQMVWFVLHNRTAVPYRQWVNDITGAGSGVQQQQRQVRMPAPAHFSGEGADSDPELALMGIEKFFASSGLPQSEWGKQIQTLLRGAALRAYSALALPLHQQGKAPPWPEVREIILNFRKRDAPTQARAKLANIRQVGSVTEYNSAFRLLLAQVGSDPPAPTDLMRYYLTGLTAPSPTTPWGAHWTSLEEAMSFHSTKELAEKKVTPRMHERRRTHLPFKPFAPRLKTVQANKRGGAPFEPQDRQQHKSGGGRGNRGGNNAYSNGRGSNQAYGRGGAQAYGRGSGQTNVGDSGNNGPSVRDIDYSCFGTTYGEITGGQFMPCPRHPNGHHKKGQCSDFQLALLAYVQKTAGKP